ncbi:MAG TPA: hypothetical protein VF957_23450 [Bradyrhizobium sp.]
MTSSILLTGVVQALLDHFDGDRRSVSLVIAPGPDTVMANPSDLRVRPEDVARLGLRVGSQLEIGLCSPAPAGEVAEPPAPLPAAVNELPAAPAVTPAAETVAMPEPPADPS